MRKFLLIFICSFSFCLRAETNLVELTEEQYRGILAIVKGLIANEIRLKSDGSLSSVIHSGSSYSKAWDYLTGNQLDILQFLHLFLTGNTYQSYDAASNNILAYASSLRSHNADVRELLDNIESNTHGVWLEQGRFYPYIRSIYDTLDVFHRDYTNNFDFLYAAITNVDLSISITNQLSQFMEGSFDSLGEIQVDLSNFSDSFNSHMRDFSIQIDNRFGELLEFLHSLSNGAFFASNMVNCCGCSNSNYQDSVIAMLNWMTNNFPDSVESPPIGGGGGSNDVWSVWRPDGGSLSGWNHLFVPSVKWVQDGNSSQQFKPLYDNQQYDTVYSGVWDQYANLLQEYRASGIDGQQFLAGLVDLQLHILANMSTQLYMIDSKMPSKTNLWNSINDEANWVRDNAESVKSEVEGQQYQVENLLNRADTSIISTYFPKVQTAISRLNTTSNDPVVRLPLPAVFGSGSGSSVWTIDVREIQGHDALRKFCRWVCIIVWSIIFVRTFIVPSLVVLCLCARFSDMACGLLFVDSLDGCHVIGETVGGLSEFVLNLIGLDTNLKRWAVGISTI